MDGIIIINKTKGCTSHDIVYKVKKVLNSKVGHTGTLDPNATGVLPLLIGKGTLMSKYLINHDKIYDVTLKLGEKTDTADSEGSILERQDVNINNLKKGYIEKVLESFLGKQKQYPPMYSAIKVNGKKLYEYARNGQKIDIEPRNIEIYDINLLNVDIENLEIHFRVKCSKGTYIRSLCEDIANKFETVGYMKELNRIQVGEFGIEESIILEDLVKNANNKEYIEDHTITVEKMFKDKESITLNDKKLQLLLNGVKLTYNLKDDVYKIYNIENKFVGIGIVKDKLLKRDIIL